MNASARPQNRPTSRASSPLVPTHQADKNHAARGRMARGKGQSGEREVAEIISRLTGHDVRRRVRQHGGDSDLVGLPYWCVEVKRYASVPPGLVAQWWDQAVRQARDTMLLPVLFYRADRSGWRCVWNADLHRRPMPQPLCSDYEATVTGAPEIWWALCSGMSNRRP